MRETVVTRCCSGLRCLRCRCCLRLPAFLTDVADCVHPNAVELDRAVAGDIVSIAGVAAAGIADTVAALEVEAALPPGEKEFCEWLHRTAIDTIQGRRQEVAQALPLCQSLMVIVLLSCAVRQDRSILLPAMLPVPNCVTALKACVCCLPPARCRPDRPAHPRHGVRSQHLAAGGPRGLAADGHQDRRPAAGQICVLVFVQVPCCVVGAGWPYAIGRQSK